MPKMNNFRLSLPKLKAIILYFANNTDTKYLGKVKLMKLFYFLDFMHVKKYGSPVTYDTYVNLDRGPIPSFIKNIVDSSADEPQKSSLSDIIKFETPSGTIMKRVLPKRDFTEQDAGLFTQTELEVLKEVTRLYSNKNTDYVEKKSHDEAPWKETKYLDEIPYVLATLDEDCDVGADEIELLLSL